MSSSLALFLVVALGLNACGVEKKNKRHQTETEKVADVAPQPNEKSAEAEKKSEENQPVEAEKKTEESKDETPAAEPIQPEAPVVEPKKPVAPAEEAAPETTVVCTMEVIDYCVQTGKGQFETVQLGRSGPECKFPEAPANTVDAAFCSKDSESKSL